MTLAGMALPFRDTAKRLWATRSYSSPAPGLPGSFKLAAYREAQACFVQRAATVEFDLLKAVDVDDSLWRRVRFAHDADTQAAITQVNLLGYAESPYGRNPKAKLQRNRALATRNPYCLAALTDERNPDLLVGFTTVLPLTQFGATSYLAQPGVPDNDVTANMVAAVGEEFTTALLFSLSQCKVFDGRYALLPVEHARSGIPYGRERDPRACAELTRLLVIQLALLIVLSGSDREITFVGQSNVRSVRMLFEHLGMKLDLHVVTGDGETPYSMVVKPKRLREAARIVANFIGGDVDPAHAVDY